MNFSKLALAAVLGLSAVSCSTTTGDHLEVKKYILNHKKRIDAVDPAIRFEQRHHLYGAVSAADMDAKDGYYYTARWSMADGSQPATLKLEYRQAKTGSKVLTQEVPVSGSAGVQEFQVIGDAAKNNGVTSWKVSLLRGKSELASFKSYMWE